MGSFSFWNYLKYVANLETSGNRIRPAIAATTLVGHQSG
jgi:hypothetical protein